MEDLVNVPGYKKLKTRHFECIRMYSDGKKCQDLYDFFARKPPLAHGLYGDVDTKMEIQRWSYRDGDKEKEMWK